MQELLNYGEDLFDNHQLLVCSCCKQQSLMFGKENLLRNFKQGLSLGRLYYIGFADFFYHNLGTEIAEKHLNKLIEGKFIEKLGEQLILTSKGLQTYYKAKAKEYNDRAKRIYVGPHIPRGFVFFLAFLIAFILLIIFANDINHWLMSF